MPSYELQSRLFIFGCRLEAILARARAAMPYVRNCRHISVRRMDGHAKIEPIRLQDCVGKVPRVVQTWEWSASPQSPPGHLEVATVDDDADLVEEVAL